MPRPVKLRRVGWEPDVTYFKPAGVRMRDLEEVVLNLEEFEAIRLSDFEKLNQKDAADRMKISQPTFSRVLESARKKIADFLVNGKSIRVEGGIYKMKGGEKNG
jgi:predicted DNA-binding protein (UPF0251 family)